MVSYILGFSTPMNCLHEVKAFIQAKTESKFQQAQALRKSSRLKRYYNQSRRWMTDSSQYLA